MKKRINKTFGAWLAGRVVLEFFNNEDEQFKQNTLKQLVKAARKEFNVAATAVDDNFVENPERGVIVYAATGIDADSARATAEKFLAYIDTNAIGRIVDEERRVEDSL